MTNRAAFFLLLSALAWTSSVFSQNLVPNPGFEHTAVYKKQGPNSSLPKDFLWWEPNPASADIYSPKNGTAPANVRGFQPAHHGSNYIGLAVMYPGAVLYRERIQAKLDEPLEKGRQYFVSFYVSRADRSVGETDQLQVGFSKRRSFERRLFNRHSVQQAAGTSEGQFPSDTGWLFVSSVYTASGKEAFVNLGSFSSVLGKHIRKMPADTTLTEPGIYYFFDDISVIAIPEDYEDMRSDSTQLNGKWLSNVPEPGDNSVFHGQTFAWNGAKIGDSLSVLLEEVADYLSVNPFIVCSLSMPRQSALFGRGFQKLLLKREQELERYFENNGVSSNRIRFLWNTETGETTVFTVLDVLYR